MVAILHASTTHHDEWKGQARYVRILIHDTLEEFRAAAHKYSGFDFSEAGGCFQGVPTKISYKKDQDGIDVTPKHYAGIIRLCMQYLNTEVVAHECVHAAAHIYRLDCWPFITLGRECLLNEEMFAYILGDLVAQVNLALHEGGIWNRVDND